MTTATTPQTAARAATSPAPARRAPRIGRAQVLAAAVVAGALCVGAAVGVTADRVIVAGRPRAEPASWLDAFAAELALTPAQRAAVDTVLDERERVIDSLVAPVRPGIDAARATARRQIRARLTPAQQARFDGYVARMAREPRAHR